MAKLNIVEWPDKVLETKSDEVSIFDEALKSFVADMFETMEDAAGIGLAANQVGVTKKVVTIHIPFENNRYEDKPEGSDKDVENPKEESKPEPWHDKKFVLINPVITQKKGVFKWQEGCLSFPEIYEYVQRSEEVWVKAFDEHGKEYELHGTGLFSVCLQHEIDHINGIVFVSRMSRLKSGMVRKKMLRRDKTTDGDFE